VGWGRRDQGIAELVEYFDRPEIVAGGWQRLANKPSELKVVIEEIRKCREDFEYCARNYFWITDKERRDVPFALWESQELLYEKFKELRAKGRAQKLLVLKARQLGFSCLIEALITWRTIFYSNVNSVIVSHAPHHSIYLFGIMQHFLERLPFWLCPMIRSHKIEEGLIFENVDPEAGRSRPGLNSRVVVQAANQNSGVAQGYRISAAHICVSTYTQIRTTGASVCQIQDIQPSDSIYTSDGKIARVKQVFKSARGPEMAARLKFWLNQDPLICTKDHRILTPDGFMPAGELHKNDWVRYPAREIESKIREFILENRGDGGASDVTWEERYPLNRDWGFFFGLFLANGNIGFKYGGGKRHGAASISFHNHAKKMERTYQMLDACLADRHRYSYQRTPNSGMARVHYAALARFTAEQFGHKEEKRIPDWVWAAGREFAEGLVSGYIFGDGCFKVKIHQLVCRSIRPAITLQLRDLIASIGCGWSAISVEEAGLIGGRNCQKQWILKANGSTCRKLACLCGVSLDPARREAPSHWRYSADQKFVEIQIREASEQWCEEFWDLEVESGLHDFTTLHCVVHNSELADVEDWRAKEIMEADLRYALADNVETMAFIETTAKGQGRYFHKFWEKMVELGEQADWMPTFFPAFMEKSRTRMPTPGWEPEEYEARVREKVSREWLRCDRCGRYKDTKSWRILQDKPCLDCQDGTYRPLLLADGQLYYFQLQRLNSSKDIESLKNYKQELCITVEDAWQVSGIQVFPHECFDVVEQTVCEPIARGFFDDGGRFHGVDYRTGTCPAEACNMDHQYDDLAFEIWDYPRDNYTYTLGADVAEGVGGDYSVVVINKVGNFNEPDEIVAQFRSNLIDPISFAFPIVHLGRWYKEALAAIEVNKYDTTFTWVRNQLQYPNLYRWKHIDSTNVNSNKWGWWTNLTSRPRLYQTAIKFLKAKMWIVRSREMLKEMATFQKDDYDDRIAEHDRGAHDDVLIASLISLYCSHDMDYDNNLGFIPVHKASSNISAYPFIMHCGSCGHKWGSTDPGAYCSKCMSIRTIAKRHQLIDAGNQKEWERMTGQSERDETDKLSEQPEYELL